MKTKEKILQAALHLFNTKGISSVSLRDIATVVGISKGNLGYHFPKKETIVEALYLAMNKALSDISSRFKVGGNLLVQMLKAPLTTYTITNQYRFLHIDYVYILQHYPQVKLQHEKQLKERMPQLIGIFDILKQQGLFRLEVTHEQCMLLMQQSTLIRAMWFVQVDGYYCETEQEKRWHYVQMVNQLLWAYLSPKGLDIYTQVMTDIHETINKV